MPTNAVALGHNQPYILLSFVLFCCIPLYFSLISLYFVVLYSGLLCCVVICCVRKHFVRFCCILFYFVVFCCVSLYFIVFCCMVQELRLARVGRVFKHSHRLFCSESWSVKSLRSSSLRRSEEILLFVEKLKILKIDTNYFKGFCILVLTIIRRCYK